MAINDKDFYAPHGISFDIEEMQIEYTKRVINQAKIEVLTELKSEIEELDTPNNGSAYLDCAEIIQQKISSLKEVKDGKDTSGYFEKEVYEAVKPYMDEYLNN